VSILNRFFLLLIFVGWIGCGEWSVVRRGRFRRYSLFKNNRVLRHRAESMEIVRLDELQAVGRRRRGDESPTNGKSDMVVNT
jgi:hypothetical protein